MKGDAVRRAMKAVRALLSPAVRIKSLRRPNRDGMRVLAYARCDGLSGRCSWPDEESFLFGGNSFMSIFEFIHLYGVVEQYKDDIWTAVAGKLTDMDRYARCSSAEELAIRLEIAGPAKKP